jgi:uncharacterized protein YbjQ (UPF0145 family)
MLAVTIDHLPGYHVREVIGEVVGSTVRRLNAFVEGVQMLSGDLNPRVPAVLRRTREAAVELMLQAAYRRGANAVIGMRFDHRPISGTWSEICAYGTAVFVVPARD